MRVLIWLVAAVAPVAHAQFVEQTKLIVTPATPTALQGAGVSVSSNGVTILVGSPNVGSPSMPGSATVFTQLTPSFVQNFSNPWNQSATFDGSGTGIADFGASVALSGDGFEAIVGAPSYGQGGPGAAFIFTRALSGADVWTQQPGPLVGSGAVSGDNVGTSVGMSYNGTIAIVGGPRNGGTQGAAWIYAEHANEWTEQARLTGDSGSLLYFGQAVAVSGDGKTAIVGAPGPPDSVDNPGYQGAAYIFTQNNGLWTQQAKLIGNGTSFAQQGASVAISGDGNTAIFGGPTDTNFRGAAWVFARNGGGQWSQQAKLVGIGGAGLSAQGFSVSISADGNTAAVGGQGDGGQLGATWVFTRVSGGWSQSGTKLVGSNPGNLVEHQGSAVAISGDAGTLVVGGDANRASFGDNLGNTWVFTQPVVKKLVVTVPPSAYAGSPSCSRLRRWTPTTIS